MHKAQTIISLLLFLVIVFSMDMIFGNPLMETFRGGGGSGRQGLSERGLGLGVGRQNILNNNNSGFLAANVPPSYFEQSDDEPLFFRFPFRFNQK
jgi:hypothetical protein